MSQPDSSGSGGAGDTRGALLDSIRKGMTLKKVMDTGGSGGGAGGGDSGSRGNLLNEIRMGKELRPAGERELGQSAPPNNRQSGDGDQADALAEALRRALLERGRVIRSSDDDDSSCTSSENDGEWD